MRVLFTLHHGLTGEAGAPGATLALGAALERAGCRVDYFDFGRAYHANAGETVSHQLRFPWATAAFLRRRARDFEVIDAATGDAWLWVALGRPGRGSPQALVTRAHGLEHVMDHNARLAAKAGATRLSWKYPLYHGGVRLWEVRRSLVAADHCVMLNEVDRAWARDRLGVPAERVSVVPNGIGEEFARAPDVETAGDGRVRLAFAGSWIARKGIHELVEAARLLGEEGVDFSLSLLGTGEEEAAVVRAFPPGLRERLSVTARYPHAELPALLAGHEILLLPSHSEGASVALLEAMACGLAPVATRVGSAPETIEQGREGTLLDPGDARAIADAVAGLARDRAQLGRMRRAAQVKARRYGWDRIAERTVALYDRLLADASGR